MHVSDSPELWSHGQCADWSWFSLRAEARKKRDDDRFKTRSQNATNEYSKNVAGARTRLKTIRIFAESIFCDTLAKNVAGLQTPRRFWAKASRKKPSHAHSLITTDSLLLALSLVTICVCCRCRSQRWYYDNVARPRLYCLALRRPFVSDK